MNEMFNERYIYVESITADSYVESSTVDTYVEPSTADDYVDSSTSALDVTGTSTAPGGIINCLCFETNLRKANA